MGRGREGEDVFEVVEKNHDGKREEEGEGDGTGRGRGSD